MLENKGQAGESKGVFAVICAALGGDAAKARIALQALADAGYVCVPRNANKRMIDAAYWSAYGEDAGGVWGLMIAEALTQEAEK